MQASEVKMQASEAPDFWGLHKNMNCFKVSFKVIKCLFKKNRN